MSGFMRLLYTENNEKVVVTTSLTSLISTIENPKFDKVRLAAALTASYGRAIPFIQGIELFDPYKYLVIKDGQRPLWIKKQIPGVKRIETLDEAISYVTSLFEEQTKVIKDALGEEIVYTNATGGLDSRLIACNLRKAGINFEYLNYPIYGPDSEIAEILSKGINVPLHTQTNTSFGEDYNDHYGEFDFLGNYLRQYPNPRWVLNHNYEFSGARGECIDLPDIYSDEDLSYMTDPRSEILLGHLMKTPRLNNKMNRAVVDFFSTYLNERCGFESNKKLTEQQQSEFSQMMGGQLADAVYNSAAQAHEYFYSMYNEWHFNHFIHNIAFDAKKGRRLTIALIKAIDPVLGGFPFVSRLNTRRNSVNEIDELPLQYKVSSPLKKYVPIWVKNLLYNYLSVRKADIDNSIIDGIDFSLYKEVIKTGFVKKNKNMYSDTLKRLYSIEVIRRRFNIQS